VSTYSQLDFSTTPPGVAIPRNYNAATDFIDRHLDEGRTENIAVIDDAGSYTYGELAARVNRAGNALTELGLRAGDRIGIALLDTIDFPAIFWGALKTGIVPVAINTLLTTDDYRYILADSRVRALIVSEPLLENFQPLFDDLPDLEHVVVSGDTAGDYPALSGLMSEAPDHLAPAATTADDVAFWLYSSGSTGSPKGVIHLHSHLVQTAALYGVGVLGIQEEDRVFSAAKLFFAYGLGNAMSFPFLVGATSILLAGRPTPAAVMDTLACHDPTIYFGVPTLYAATLADPAIDVGRQSTGLRLCVSAGEALPEDVGKRWEKRFGVPVLDGIGSTEMLHIFLSNSPGDVVYGTSGKPVPGYEMKLVDHLGVDTPQGEIGELIVNGPSSAAAYWNQRQKSLDTFRGRWTWTGDKYTVDEGGYFRYSGRSDDMLKVSGQWVSPFEVESALIEHEGVLEAAVVGDTDDDDLIKPRAYIVLNDGITGDQTLAEEIQGFVKGRLALHKYPRWIEFVPELPKTATGKIQRFRLRGN
jgi:benzoate-CoA ligase family protein